MILNPEPSDVNKDRLDQWAVESQTASRDMQKKWQERVKHDPAKFHTFTPTNQGEKR